MKEICLKLSDIPEGKKVKIDSVVCGDNVKHRLCSLGVLKGKTVEMIKNDSSGPIILKVLDSKLAVGREQAKNIFICKSGLKK